MAGGRKRGSDLDGAGHGAPIALPCLGLCEGLFFGSFVPVEVGERGSGVPQTPPAHQSEISWHLPRLRQVFGEGKGVKTPRRVSGLLGEF